MYSGQVVAWGIVSLIFGPPMAKWPYKLARFEERLDAIDRKPSGPVEPADWNVALTRLLGLALSVVGVAFLVFCVLL